VIADVEDAIAARAGHLLELHQVAGLVDVVAQQRADLVALRLAVERVELDKRVLLGEERGLGAPTTTMSK